ncbi:hypothetical protein FH972_023188 [Carpinus fangiana]|uniref:Uncharacterized protein n=1 Tax=Carpinus fangiana TaxID=176857 RepID=A0A5N6KUQ5_9ROSI|nr:hypothetical protein FH972_023188 [Carpinus fangiana]
MAAQMALTRYVVPPLLKLSTLPTRLSPQTATPSSADKNDVMAENKEKARAVMAAGLRGGSGTPNPPKHASSKSPTDPSDAAEDSTQSRKRSRSGSRKPAPSDETSSSLQPSLKDLYLDQYTTRDQLAFSAMDAEDRRLKAIVDTLSAQKQAMHEFSIRTTEDARRNPPRLKYPGQRKRFADRKTRELRVSRQDRIQQAEQLEELVPIRLDLEFEKLRLRDTFTWNLHDRTVPPEILAQGLIEDFRVPPEAAHALTDQVYHNIVDQITDYHPHIFIEEEPLDPHLPYSAYKNDEMRIKIALNITIGQHTLVDNFDWDINNPHNDPEEFARIMALELSLSGEFTTAITHSIREQCQLFSKSLYVSNHQFDGRPIDDTEIQENMLPTPISSSFRPFQQAKDYNPVFYELNDADLERQELVFSREQRQQKRSGNNRRGGPQMPALKDRLKTWRTMVVSSVIPGAAETVETSGLLRISRSSGKRKAWNRGDDSDVSESDEEDDGVDSPARALQGTSRTRGMRGAASAAQVAMRQSLNTRSQTPEHILHHHETRSLPRKYGGYEIREDSNGEPTSFMAPNQSPSPFQRPSSATAAAATTPGSSNAGVSYMPSPPNFPRSMVQYDWQSQHNQHPRLMQGLYERMMQKGSPPPRGPFGGSPWTHQLPHENPQHYTSHPQHLDSASSPLRHDSLLQQFLHSNASHSEAPKYLPQARMSTAFTPVTTRKDSPSPSFHQFAPSARASRTKDTPVPPTPPSWLTDSLPALQSEFKQDSFGPQMRWSDKFQQWQPRIRCNDCPGTLYNTDQADPTKNFRVHLANMKHIQNRNERLARGG